MTPASAIQVFELKWSTYTFGDLIVSIIITLKVITLASYLNAWTFENNYVKDVSLPGCMQTVKKANLFAVISIILQKYSWILYNNLLSDLWWQKIQVQIYRANKSYFQLKVKTLVRNLKTRNGMQGNNINFKEAVTRLCKVIRKLCAKYYTDYKIFWEKDTGALHEFL